eukprot:scaffold3179_cov59-Phaeocystis_antarctica.AAC.3
MRFPSFVNPPPINLRRPRVSQHQRRTARDAPSPGHLASPLPAGAPAQQVRRARRFGAVGQAVLRLEGVPGRVRHALRPPRHALGPRAHAWLPRRDPPEPVALQGQGRARRRHRHRRPRHLGRAGGLGLLTS